MSILERILKPNTKQLTFDEENYILEDANEKRHGKETDEEN